MCGTPEYIAPEILKNEGHSFAVDWWSFGVLLYEMLLGVTPFYDQSPKEIYNKILNGKVYFPKDFPSDAKSLIKHLLVANLSKRYGNLKGGYKDIAEHRFFKKFDFNLLEIQKH